MEKDCILLCIVANKYLRRLHRNYSSMRYYSMDSVKACFTRKNTTKCSKEYNWPSLHHSNSCRFLRGPSSIFIIPIPWSYTMNNQGLRDSITKWLQSTTFPTTSLTGCSVRRCNRQSAFTLLHFIIFHWFCVLLLIYLDNDLN